MDIYFEMAKHPVFTIEDVNLFYDMTKGVYIGVWNLVVPSDLLYMKNGEGSMNAAV